MQFGFLLIIKIYTNAEQRRWQHMVLVKCRGAARNWKNKHSVIMILHIKDTKDKTGRSRTLLSVCFSKELEAPKCR